MARITIPEFKSGELVEPETFNQMNESFRTIEIDSENLSIEGIHQRSVSDNTVFDTIVSSNFNISPTIKAVFDSDDLPDVFPLVDGGGTSPVGDEVSFSSVLSTEKVIIRTSCRVTMDDFGARTFSTGIPPWVALMVRKFQSGAWSDLPETLQHFALAFSGKTPGTSHTNIELPVLGAGDSSVGTGMTYTADIDYNGYRTDDSDMMFDYDFSYTSAYLYAPSTDQTNVSFRLWGFQQLYKNDPNIFESLRPKQLGFKVQDFNMTAYKIKR